MEEGEAVDPHAVQSDAQTMTFEYAVERSRWTWSEQLRDLYGLRAEQEPTTELLLDRLAEQDRLVLLATLEDLLGRPGAQSCVCQLLDQHGRMRRVIFVGQSSAQAGTMARLTGFMVDITEPVRETARAAVAASAEHRATIEQAKGALMVTFGVDEDAAFELLRSYSSQHNIKLTVVAARLVAGVTDRAFSGQEPVSTLLDIVVGLRDIAGTAEVGALVRTRRDSA